jgi:hypothetical protein
MLDFTASAAELGKPGGGADLKLGLATAPALYAWDEFPELGELIERKFERDGDVDRVRSYFFFIHLGDLLLSPSPRPEGFSDCALSHRPST